MVLELTCKVAIGICWGQDPCIFRLLDSIPKEWKIYVIDGRFTNSKLETEYASKKLRGRVSSYPNVELCNRSGMEYDVRNKYLEEMGGYDYAIMLDTDEYIIEYNKEVFEEHIKKLKEGYHLIDVWYDNEQRQQGRFFINPNNWRYHKSHKYVTNGKEVKAIYKADSVILGITVRHDDAPRPEELKQIIEDYQQQLWKYEDVLF